MDSPLSHQFISFMRQLSVKPNIFPAAVASCLSKTQNFKDEGYNQKYSRCAWARDDRKVTDKDKQAEKERRLYRETEREREIDGQRRTETVTDKEQEKDKQHRYREMEGETRHTGKVGQRETQTDRQTDRQRQKEGVTDRQAHT
ncbi:hypothetical protein ElyMa_000703400 [Elysia marginata]|uniref:Uncharacterized protein n=1 Tax=Elysia marginata TaxID=1093978 RepID=A0AAV4GKZ0_9GAST|nr:hypothetical protein ElyMa_000703400 [Elysia marginata]